MLNVIISRAAAISWKWDLLNEILMEETSFNEESLQHYRYQAPRIVAIRLHPAPEKLRNRTTSEKGSFCI